MRYTAGCRIQATDMHGPHTSRFQLCQHVSSSSTERTRKQTGKVTQPPHASKRSTIYCDAPLLALMEHVGSPQVHDAASHMYASSAARISSSLPCQQQGPALLRSPARPAACCWRGAAATHTSGTGVGYRWRSALPATPVAPKQQAGSKLVQREQCT
jgi:hypothetical protein